MELTARDDQAAFAAKPETTGRLSATAPQTGAEYLESLRDGRTVFIYGERVSDVTTHPAFRNGARSRLYDALHDPKTKRRSCRSDRYRLGRLYPQVLSCRPIA